MYPLPSIPFVASGRLPVLLALTLALYMGVVYLLFALQRVMLDMTRKVALMNT